MTLKTPYLKFAAGLLAFLIVLVPFHAAAVTIIGAHVSFKPILQAWKELLIVVIALMCLIAYIRDKRLFRFDAINILAFAIIAVSLGVTSIARPEWNGILAGVKTNISVLVLFFAAQIVASYFSTQRLIKIILIPALLVGVLAVIQPWVFPPSVLNHLGYSANSIIAGQYIESASGSLRVFSTLGGPNQLGTYLIIPLILCLVLAIKRKSWWWLLATIGFCIPLYMTYSRSAWLGAGVAVVVTLLVGMNKKIQIGAVVVLAGLLLATGFFISRVNICQQLPSINSRFLHGDCSSGTLTGSDLQRLGSQKSGILLIKAQVLGYGLGTAGPASFYTTHPVITENWYLQIALEIGLLGLTLYLVFFALLLYRFYLSSNDDSQNSEISTMLFAVILGLAVSSLFLHSLADSTLAIILFALLGIQKTRVMK